MLISSALSGFTLNEADNLRKAMGKKKPEIMQKFSEQFVAGAMKNGCAEPVARQIWDNILKFGGYGFNKSHSTAYAVLTWQTAWLKANHRSAFLAANLSCEMSNSAKVREFVEDAKKSGVEILPPSIGLGTWEFEPEGRSVRFGFGAIKGTGQKAIEHLVAARGKLRAKERKPTLHELCAQLDSTEVGKVCWEALIKAGAFDEQGHNRGAVMAALSTAQNEGARFAADRRAGQASMFGGEEPGPADSPAKDGIDPAKAWPKAETLRAEQEVLGFYLSGHPLEERAGLLALLATGRISDLAGQKGGSEVMVAGMVVSLAETTVKSGRFEGKKMARLRLEDLTGSIGVTCFPRTWEEQKSRLAEGAVVVVGAKLEEKGEESALLLESVWSVEEAIGRFQGAVVVSIEPEDEGLVERLVELVARHKGRNQLYLQVLGADGMLRRVRAGSQHKVSVSEGLAKELEALLGPGRTRLAKL
jgi:DNA polymerase-3 subunit alpha